MNNENDKTYNLKTLVLYIKNNFITVTSLTLVSVIIFSYFYINTPQEYKADIKIYKKAELENNLDTSNIRNLTYDFSTEKLFELFKTNIQDERKIEEIYKNFIKKSNITNGEFPNKIFPYFQFDLRPEYLSITLKTESSLLSKEFLTYTIPELNNVSKNNLINRLKSELVNQDLVKDRFYEIEKERNTAQLNSITDALLDIEETLSNQKINIIDILDQNISTAKTLGWKDPQIDILSSLSHKDENRIVIEETLAESKFLSSNFNSYPAYLFGYDVLNSIKQSVSDNANTYSIDNIIFNESKKISNLERENKNIYLADLEKTYFTETLVINFIREQINSGEFRLVNFNISSISLENTKFAYPLYLLVAILFGLVFSLLYLFIRDISITNISD